MIWGAGTHFWYSMQVSHVMVKPAGTGRPILLLHKGRAVDVSPERLGGACG